MKIMGPVSESEMVLAFLQAEIESPRFGLRVKRLLGRYGLNEDVIIHPNLLDESENCIRAELLGLHRGFQQGQYLFRGFPSDTQWRKVLFSKADLKKLKYAKCPTWEQLSGGTRRVTDGAKSVERIEVGESANDNIRAVADAVRKGKKFPALVAVGLDVERGDLVLVEGHARATAYLLADSDIGDVEVIVGISKAMIDWPFY